MLIQDNCVAHSWENGKWVINSPAGRNFLINEVTYRLFTILKHSQTLEEAHQNFEKEFSITISFEDFQQHISKTIGGFGILNNDFEVERPSMQNRYLKLKVQLINPYIAGILVKPLVPLYKPNRFWYLLVGVISVVLIILLVKPIKLDFAYSSMPLTLFLIYLAMLIHELGHIAACKASGLKHGGIGFGFYFIFPVMYADITNIWGASREKRIIANLGGIFSEIFYSTVLLIVYLFTQNHVFYIAGFSIATITFWELNPFVRRDGYWILSDITNTPNLLKKSKETIKLFFERLKNNEKPLLVNTEIGLLIYGLVNTFFILFFMALAIFRYKTQIYYFPKIVYEIAKKWIGGDWETINILDQQFLIILTFYIFLIRFCYQNYRKISYSWLKRVG